MKNRNTLASLFCVFFVLTACGGPKNTEKAAQAMERARAAEAPTYAPNEFAKADALYKQMVEAVNAKQNKEASALADQTVVAANEATARARENMAVQLIGELAMLLAEAQKQGLHESQGQAYNQATQSHIDAQSFMDAADFEKAIQAAQMGLDILRPLVSKAFNEARELLERARKRYESTLAAPESKNYRDTLNKAKKEIDAAQAAFNKYDYETSKRHAQKALNLLNELAALIGRSGAPVSKDNLQLQAHDLIRRLKDTIDYIKENGYTNTCLVQDAYGNIIPEKPETADLPADEDIFIIMEEEQDADYTEDTNELSMTSIQYRAQSMVEGEQEKICFTNIEAKYEEALAAYNENNYINAVDSAREGQRLADLYLAAQSIGNHKVSRGDTLWGISGKYYNRRYFLWNNIWMANKLKVKDPDLIYPGQVFRIPPAPRPVR